MSLCVVLSFVSPKLDFPTGDSSFVVYVWRKNYETEGRWPGISFPAVRALGAPEARPATVESGDNEDRVPRGASLLHMPLL